MVCLRMLRQVLVRLLLVVDGFGIAQALCTWKPYYYLLYFFFWPDLVGEVMANIIVLNSLRFCSSRYRDIFFVCIWYHVRTWDDIVK